VSVCLQAVAIEKSIRSPCICIDDSRARGASPTIRVSAGVRISGQSLLQERRGIAVLASVASRWGLTSLAARLRLGGRAIVAMVEAADLRSRDDTPGRRRHHRACDRHILVERKMRTGAHVVRDVVREHPMQPCCAENDDVIEALTSDRADDAFHVGVLLRRSRSGADRLDVHGGDRSRDVGKHRIAIVHEIAGRVVFRKGVAELLCGPGRGGMFGDRHVNDPSRVVREDDQDEQQPERDRRHDEQISGHNLARVVGEERPPRL
jgi:hypothetical protein